MSSQFQLYLEAICAVYEQRAHFYTQTDAEGRETVFDLMVETAKEKTRDDRDQPKKREKIERLPVLEGLQKYAPNHVLLVGRPGSGKSTALEQLLLALAKKSQQDAALPIPVLVQLKADRPILPLICETVRRHRLRLKEDELNDLLFDSKLLLLLDGVNEIPQEALRQNLQQFRDDNLNVPMVFTTRDLELGGTLGIEKKLKMQPLTAEQLKEFVGKYLPEQEEALLGQLNDRLKELAETPLLLKMLCDVFRLEGELPRSRGALFRTVDQKYEEIKGTVPASADFRRFKPELLQHLAFGMLAGEALEPQLRLPRSEAEQRLEALLTGRMNAPGQAAKEWLEDLLEHHLLQVADDPKQIEFHHQLFLEYYAAEALLSRVARLGDEPLKREFLNYLKWTEPVALMLALLEDEAQAVRVVKLALDVDLMLGASLAGEVEREFQKQTLNLVVQYEAPDQLKVQLLKSTHSRGAVPYFLQALQNTEPFIRAKAIEALEDICNDAEAILFLQAMADEHPFVRGSAATVLGKTHSSLVLIPLVEALADEHPFVRGNAAMALGELGDKVAIPRLLQALHDEHPFVRGNAAMALGELGDKVAIPRLLQALHDEYPFVRGNAAMALGELGDINDENAFNSLASALQDIHPYVRKNASASLEKTYGKTKLEILQLEGSEKLGIPSVTIDQDEFAQPKSTEALIQSLQNEDLILRQQAVDLLVESSNLNIVETEILVKALQHPVPEIRKDVAEVIGKLADPQFLPDLISLQQSIAADHIFTAISGIQARCRFYNYKIFQADLEAQKNDRSTRQTSDHSSTIINNYPNVTEVKQTIMSNSSKYNFPAAQKVQIFEQVTTYIENNHPTNPEVKTAIADLTLLLTQLQTQHPQVTTEFQALTVLDAEFTEIRQSTTHPFVTLRQQLLNPERHLQAIKATFAEVAKHYLEESVWSKAVVTYLDKLSETPDQRV